MNVKELRDQLAAMPGEMSVYAVSGEGIASAKHLFKLNLVSVEQCCEIRTYFQEHTESVLDSLIERKTGFRNREELIEAYLSLKGTDQ